jgi:threonine dehydratase
MSGTPLKLPTIDDVRAAEAVLRKHISAVPMVRSYPLEQRLGLPPGRRVWLKDFGWTPVGSFKLQGALNWMEHNHRAAEGRPIVAHSSGNFASGISFAGQRYGQRVIVVMPEAAPRIKFERTRSFGAEVRTYDQARDHITGDRERLAQELVQQGALLAKPYDDPHVIAGNGVGALEVAADLQREGRAVSHYLCPVSGGGLLSGHAIAINHAFPAARIIGVEPSEADDYCRSLAAGEPVRLQRPVSICDGLLCYQVGQYNWPILSRLVPTAVAIPDLDTRKAMKWLYEQHGLRAEPSGAIATAALLSGNVDLTGDGDIVAVVSGRNVDDATFRNWIETV